MVRVLERVVLALMFLDGASVGFYPGDLRLLMNDTAALQPTVLVTVPRLVSGVYDTQGVDAVGGIQKLVFDQRAPLEARVEPLNADAGSDCDSGGHSWQLDGDAGSSHARDTSIDFYSDDRGRSSSGYCDSGWRHCTIVSSRLTPGQVTPETPAATPAPTIEVEAAAAIATPAGATARSCRAD
uniref:Secreted protein n=1 Tax=Phytophthora fragariae TaxID=53985 RepID=A0A6A3DFH4_9STRA|nr:hypothetical protein PF009_g29993 [Phytophthora fragariae]